VENSGSQKFQCKSRPPVNREVESVCAPSVGAAGDLAWQRLE